MRYGETAPRIDEQPAIYVPGARPPAAEQPPASGYARPQAVYPGDETSRSGTATQERDAAPAYRPLVPPSDKPPIPAGSDEETALPPAAAEETNPYLADADNTDGQPQPIPAQEAAKEVTPSPDGRPPSPPPRSAAFAPVAEVGYQAAERPAPVPQQVPLPEPYSVQESRRPDDRIQQPALPHGPESEIPFDYRSTKLDVVLSKLSQVNLIAPPRVEYRVISEVVATHVESQRAAFRKNPVPLNARTILTASFAPGTMPETVTDPAQAWFKSVNMSVADAFNSMPAEVMVDVLAATAYEGDPAMVEAVDFMTQVIEQFRGNLDDPRTLSDFTGDKFPLEILRDTLLKYMGARKLTNEAPTLTREAHQFVQGALGERPQNNPQMVQRLGSLLRQLAPTTPPELEVARPPEERQQHYAAAQNAYPLRRISSSGVTVANYAINGGRPARQIYQASALSWALPALSSGEVPELPNVAAVVMTGVHKAPIEPLRMNLDQLRADGVSMLVQGRPDDPVLPLFSTGHFAVGQQSPAAATALSPFFGTTERARTASVAYGRHGSDNTGDNDGGSNNFEQGAQKAKGSGTTWGFTEGLGVTYDETVTENIATEATLTPEHLSDKVQPAEVVLFVGNTVLGAYNARTMRWERDFPPEVPQHPNNLSHVKAKINGIEAANAAARAQMQDKPANAAGLSDGVPLHQLPGAVREAAKMEPETAWGRKKELGRRYKDLHGVAAFSGRKETATNAALDFWYENLYIPSYEGDLRDSYNVSVGWIGWMHHNGLLGAREYQTALESLRLQA